MKKLESNHLRVSSCMGLLEQVLKSAIYYLNEISYLGKTLLAKAVANETSATFLRVVGSELIQKYLGDGPKLVRELFRVAEDHAPALIFIDEIDAVGTKRYDSHRY